MEAAEKITELTPPRTREVRSSGGLPVTAIARGHIDSLDGGTRSRVPITLDFEGHGIGKLLMPLVIRRRPVGNCHTNAARLKERLERA